MKRVLSMLPVLLVMVGLAAAAQAQFPPQSQAPDNDNSGLPARAFDNVTIHLADGSTVESGTIVWRGGVVEAMGSNVTIPFDALVTDGGDSLHVYPGFLDGYAEWSSPEAIDFDETPRYRGSPTMVRAGIRPDRRAREVLTMDSDNLASALQHGITSGNMAARGYMVPGQTDLFLLKTQLETGDLFMGGTGMQMQFEDSDGVFPGTTMGVVSRMHQLWYDAEAHRDWQTYYASNASQLSPPDHEPQLEAMVPVMDGEQRVFFKVDSKENIERVFKLQDELGFEAVIVSGLGAWKVADELNRRGIPVLASVDFPDEPEWHSDEEEGDSGEELTDADQEFRDKQWNAYLEAVRNIRTLMDAGVEVGFATAGTGLGDLKGHMATLLEHGQMGEDELLQLLTVHTAEILNASGALGDLTTGRVASFSVMSDAFTSEDAEALYTVSDGSLIEHND
ncbi:MAG: hypothetical protein U5K31_14935 [Balneolaceae bacterium]|nr:hypothetical protein [Balneolaceae bacterium]